MDAPNAMGALRMGADAAWEHNAASGSALERDQAREAALSRSSVIHRIWPARHVAWRHDPLADADHRAAHEAGLPAVIDPCEGVVMPGGHFTTVIVGWRLSRKRASRL